MYKILFCIAIILTGLNVRGQLSISSDLNPEQLVKNVLLNKNADIKIENVEYYGSQQSIGYFRDANCTLLSQGIIISTGKVENAAGPNNSTREGNFTGGFHDPELDKIAKGETRDAAVLEFDFTSNADSVFFTFFFASEEYPEYVNKGVNDVFAFFLTDAVGNTKNIAVLESDGSPVTVDNINANNHQEFYISNDFTYTGITDKPDLIKLAYTYQFDGFTTPIKVGSQILPNQKYHLKIAIADVGDALYDSAIFLEAGSFNHQEKTKTQKQDSLFVNNINISRQIKENGKASIKMNIQFAYASDRIVGETSFGLLDEIFNALQTDQGLSLEIVGHTDQVGTESYNKTLSYNRAGQVYNYLVKKGIDAARINYSGVGYTGNRDNKSEDQAAERRVDFIFKK